MANILEKMFASQTAEAKKQWAQNITLAEIEEQERQGMDMSEIRVIFEELQAEKQRCIDATDLSKLNKYKKAPRSADDDFGNEVAKFNKLSDKKKPLLEQAPLVYGRVVQAYHALYKSNPKNKEGGGIVFLYALDDAHRYDEEWLAKTAKRISDMAESVTQQPESTVEKICNFLNLNDSFLFKITIGSMMEKKRYGFLPEDCRDFIMSLKNERSRFCYRLGKTLNDGADAWCATFSLCDQNKLPMAQIPHNRIIPLLITEQKEGYGGLDDGAQLIPPSYYSK